MVEDYDAREASVTVSGDDLVRDLCIIQLDEKRNETYHM